MLLTPYDKDALAALRIEVLKPRQQNIRQPLDDA